MHNAHAFITYVFWLNTISLPLVVIGIGLKPRVTVGDFISVLFGCFNIAWTAILLWG